MQLHSQNGRWVIAELRVIPDSDRLDLHRLLDETKFWMETGMGDWAAESARKLAHFAQALPQGIAVRVPSGGLTARHLRLIPFRKVGEHHPVTRAWRRIAKDLGGQFRRAQALGRGDIKLARIAKLYVDAMSRGSRTQNVDVAAQLGLKESQVRDAIHRARLRGLLSDTRKQGAAGGELTAKAFDILTGVNSEVASSSSKPSSGSKRASSRKAILRNRRGGSKRRTSRNG
jgi:hypothetical protein